jgi:4-amino-4-deoxy-L-arabinose transferase-like glycosyltransferase
LRPTPLNYSDRTRRATDTLALIAFCGFLFFVGLQLIGVVGADEPRYAQVAREMLARHDWVTPVLYGNAWLEKPPLYYWGAMLAYKATGGVSDTAAKLPSVVLSCLLVFFIYLWARRFRPGMQLDAALITASAVMIIAFGRAASTDMPLAATFTLAMLCWFGWYAGKGKASLFGFYLFLALATLAKGPVAVLLAAMIVVAFAALRRDWRLLGQTLWPIGITLYLAVSAPWFIAVQRANPQFFREFFLQHNLQRFATNLYHHPQPFWFYWAVILVALAPWTVFAVEAVVDAVRGWRSAAQRSEPEEALRIYLSLWLLLPIIFFSLSRSKLPGYILPAIPAATILLADFILRREQSGAKPAQWMVLLHGLLCAGMLAAAFIAPFKLLHLDLPRGVLIIAITLAVITILMLWMTLRSQGYRMLRFATLLPLLIAFALTLKGTAPTINLSQSERPVEAALEQTELGRIPEIAAYDIGAAREYGLAFYRNHRLASYDTDEIPAGDHIVVAAAGTQKELEYRLPGRKVVRFGGFTLQHLDFYFVTKASASTP